MKTERECREQWVAEATKFVATIEVIQKDNPEMPSFAYSQWQNEMESIRKQLSEITPMPSC
tara:strand:+ start:788 stop:970 length:183 start_codon:yes stop_codon:yes gene_type:complete